MDLLTESVDLERLLHSLQVIAKTVNSDLALDTILETVVETVHAQSHWPMVSIARVDEERDEVVWVAARGFVRSGVGYSPRWPSSLSLTPAVVDVGHPMIVEDLAALDGYPAVRDNAGRSGYRSALIVPLRLEGERAAMWLCSPRVQAASRAEVAFAQAMAEQVAIAINQARLIRQQREAIEELHRANALAASKNSAIEHLITTHTRLVQMVLDDNGFEPIAEAVADLLGNPVVIEDPLFRPLFSNWAAAEPEQPRFETVWSEARRQMLGLAPKHRSALLEPESGLSLPWRHLIVPIVAGKEVLGSIYVFEINKPFEEIDSLIAEQAAIVLALEMIKERTRSQAELELKTEFLHDLLSGQYAAADDIHRRAALAGIDLASPMSLLLVAPDPPARIEVFPLLLDTINRWLARASPGSVAIQQGGSAVVLAPTTTDPAEFAARLQRHLPPEISVSVGIGSGCTKIEDYPRSYREARKALGVIRHLEQTRRVLAFADLGIYGVLFREQEAEEMNEFAARTLSALLVYDQKRGTQLVDTLQAFLHTNGNFRRTAEDLSIHLTTLRYRLQRIEAFLQADLNDAETRFNLQLALKIHHWSRRNRPGPAPRGERSQLPAKG